jgi:hypothetical protein
MRSGSQILFGHLPEQTVDADGGIWKVKRWNNPKVEAAIDGSALKEELIRAAYPWSEEGKDGGFVADLYANRTVRVRSLNKEEGLWCEPFPRLYLCRVCKRLHDNPVGRCECGSTARRGQLPFVGFHEACGAIKTPYVRKCPKHHQRAVRFPGTASASELIFYCPVCQDVIHRGFGAACDCDKGGTLSFTVHRSGAVFKPRGVVVINPPRREVLQQVQDAGGGERALQWIIDGMTGQNVNDAPAANNPEAIRRVLIDRGFDAATIEAMVAAMPQPQTRDLQQIPLDAAVAELARQQARQVALATFESRLTVRTLAEKATSERLSNLYAQDYPAALRQAGLDRVELIDRFPVLTAQFGYTRGLSEPGGSQLRTYRESNGEYTIFGELSQTEALFLRLDPLIIHRWLRSRQVNLRDATDKREASLSILQALDVSTEHPVTRLLTTLIHSYSHAFIRRAAVYAGIERDSLSELVLPHLFGFFVYAAARGDFVLGGLQALFETDLHLLLDQLVLDEHRCALDPGCRDNGGACAVCLHLGEPSCRLFNTLLSRDVLAGGQGYFDVTSPN